LKVLFKQITYFYTELNLPTFMTTQEVANRLVELVAQGKYDEAQNELYHPDAISQEPEGAQGVGNAYGLLAIKEKGKGWDEMVEAYHGGSVDGPLVSGNWFTIVLHMDITYKGMPRMNDSEICVYCVQDGKIVSEQFFYSRG
jgi:hypothetical protein